MRWTPAPTEVDGVPLSRLATLDFVRQANGFSDDSYCPQHGRHGSGYGPCICDRWWKCPECGAVTWGLYCHQGGVGVQNLEIMDETFESLPNPYRVAWQKWVDGRPYSHVLKTEPASFGLIQSKARKFDIREDDRGFAVGDLLILQEWDDYKEIYTGREIRRVVTGILHHREMVEMRDRFFDEDGGFDRKQRLPHWIEHFPHGVAVMSLGEVL